MATLNEVVVDSSIIIACSIPQEQTKWARQKMAQYTTFHILDLTYYEVANAFKHMVPKRLTPMEAKTTFSVAQQMMDIFIVHSYSKIINDAYALAVDINATVYDAAFVSLADYLGIRFLTLDVDLAKKLQTTEYRKLLDFPNT